MSDETSERITLDWASPGPSPDVRARDLEALLASRQGRRTAFAVTKRASRLFPALVQRLKEEGFVVEVVENPGPASLPYGSGAGVFTGIEKKGPAKLEK